MTLIPLPFIDRNQRYDLRETAAYLRIGRSKLFSKIKAGEIKTILDGKRLVPGSEIIRLSTLPADSAAA